METATLTAVRFTCRRYGMSQHVALFCTAPLVTTEHPGMQKAIEQATAFRRWMTACLDRHHHLDYDKPEHLTEAEWNDDRRANDAALLDGSRLVSSYNIPEELKADRSPDDAFPDERIFIITEAVEGLPTTREQTTIIFPSEY